MPRRLCAVFALAAVSGCSMALGGPDPERPRHRPPTCDTGKGLIALDSVVGGGFGVAALVALGDGSDDGMVAGLVLGLISASYIGAAIRGNGVVNECREAFASFTAEPAPVAKGASVTTPRPIHLPVVRYPAGANLPPAAASPTRDTGDVEPEAEDDAGPAPVPTPPGAAPNPVPAVQAPAKPPVASPVRSADWSQFWREVP